MQKGQIINNPVRGFILKLKLSLSVLFSKKSGFILINEKGLSSYGSGLPYIQTVITSYPAVIHFYNAIYLGISQNKKFMQDFIKSLPKGYQKQLKKDLEDIQSKYHLSTEPEKLKPKDSYFG